MFVATFISAVRYAIVTSFLDSKELTLTGEVYEGFEGDHYLPDLRTFRDAKARLLMAFL